MSKEKTAKRKPIRRIILIVLAAILLLFSVFSAIVSLPSVLFFAVGLIGMVPMSVFAVKLDSADVRSNRIEQLTNAAAQAAIFTGILCLL